MLHGREEGIITRFLDNKLVEIEIEDGFRIPVLRTELAIVSAEEAVRFKRETPVDDRQPVSREVFANKGVYMAFLLINDTALALYLINNTDLELPYTIGEVQQENYKGLQAGVLKARTSVKIQEVNTKNFENWPAYLLQFLFFKAGAGAIQEPLTKKIRFRANTFFKSKQTAPVLGKDAYVFQVDKEATEIQPQKITDALYGENTAEVKPARLPAPARETDLHIEKLSKDHAKMGSPQILQLQLQTFESTLDQAIANGMEEIIFIHGVGNGVLRTEIHKRLSKNKQVEYFKDAMKEKFGYGATLVKIK
ncbi:DUF2027 domain-containing protein [Rhodocytophaga rosea]|uniref:DUF2027 domain-containing protein n=2 Tax=Rhodocytophaga rosea TaxID=2704465 RepID=A0A6C0GUX7_9BACT|nr:DUF2027 domain-containing protein [Rhodocytophaga rosea]